LHLIKWHKLHITDPNQISQNYASTEGNAYLTDAANKLGQLSKCVKLNVIDIINIKVMSK